MDNPIPNNFSNSDEQVSDSKKKIRRINLEDINLKGIAIAILLIVVIWLGWSIIQGLSNVGSGFGSTVMYWLRRASINPDNRQGFTFFLKLLLSASFIGTILLILRKK